MQNKKRMKTMIAATAMIGVLAIGGISAYFTDGDTATNTFTVGKVSIDLQEPNWNPPKDITPVLSWKPKNLSYPKHRKTII